MQTDLTIRQARAADVPQLEALERNTYALEGYPSALFYQAIAQWPEFTIVATKSNRVLGYLLAAPGTNSELWIMSLLIDSMARGQGIGAVLVKHLINHISQSPSKFKHLKLSVSPTNLAAIALYQKMGFSTQNQIDDFLGPGEPRLIMRY
ncbi:N-acetyltransferase [Pseudidiomarina gelatinasegens]|uniref:N-acetyltransferase n=1 Tax=Pseudidiomarina gelatinasegens TaxID=2487740 RepID=A0A451GEL5_9GAMM|nr:N-acetyltransferase [Pseudidiomarina gelatinasegens]RWU11527.1 N-acetyltransferase [Pseudidiomarina gelatinasegens]|tara:strand:- start:942 stop:1391 length:450 start_codon:yes stop_codon:yes gene_type:complete